MDRRTYFLKSLQHHAHYSRQWMLRALSTVIGEPKSIPGKTLEWMLKHEDDGVKVFVPDEQGNFNWEILEGVEPYSIPFIYHEPTGFVLQVGDLPNVVEPIEDCTWGDILFNARSLVYAFGSKVPYAVGPVDISALEKTVLEKVKSNPIPPEVKDPNSIYIDEYLRFGKANADLASYELIIPSVTEHALQASPNTASLKAKLLEENKDNLNDPIVQAKIQDALIDDWKQYLKGDPAEGVISSKKTIGTAIKRMFLIHGPEAGFSEGGRAELITTTLDEGLDVKKYPAMVNSARNGAYSRGALTALAGEDVDLLARAFQDVKITDKFCGTKVTTRMTLGKEHIMRYREEQGNYVLITEEYVSQNQGADVNVYTADRCILPFGDVCPICMGAKLAQYPTSLGSMVGDVPSGMMSVMMGSAHAKELKTTKIDLGDLIR